jgi:hypothetical protein
MSTVLVVLSVLSFPIATWYLETIATSRQKMMRLRVLATYFQTDELATLIKINWPKWIYFTLPLQLPISYSKCLASSSGWNQLYTFYAYIYGPLTIFIILFVMIRRSRQSSYKREGLASVLIFLLVMWYAPIFQTIGSMYDCFSDHERDDGYYLVFDPSVSCKLYPEHLVTEYFEDNPINPVENQYTATSFSKSHLLVHIHTGVIWLFVGLGFLIFFPSKLRTLKKNNGLTAASSFASLFQYYTPAMAHFER